MTIPDAAARREALDPARSFIVQAPAGSGKTEILIQRMLTLLARVDEPEEITAITFTRKAAGEMRQRITRALRSAALPAPEEAHQRHTWELAQAVVARDQERQWDLADHPGRLRIQTIDSLCASLTRQMPLLTRFGQAPATQTEPRPLYREAARRTLAELESGDGWSDFLAELLRHLDNRVDTVESLLAEMLARRDQWLRHVVGSGMDRAELEHALAGLIQDTLRAARRALPRDQRQPLAELVRYAANSLPMGSESRIHACAEWPDDPPVTTDSLPQWQGLVETLLTKQDTWRSRVDKKLGFPAPSATKNKEEKTRFTERNAAMKARLAELAESPDLLERLAMIRILPAPNYTDRQWRVLQALGKVLPMAVAQLLELFRERGEVDFSEVSQRALRALGEPDQPTDLALTLDYAIQHLLMDEFQDTSLSQFELIERLTAGWTPGDGRTLFLVGDPMQSIYRFREAEVGLFLRARQHGIGGLSLHPLRLEANFRSQAGVVAWVNQAFHQLLPAAEDPASGAVPYAASTAARPALPEPAVIAHGLPKTNGEAEAARVVELVSQALAENPSGDIAILVRARSHLAAIVPALKQAGIRFLALELDNLASRPVVQDLLSLTRALLYPTDRVAWLSVLRAPWCGLTLPDLHALAQTPRSLPARLRQWLSEGEPELTTDGRLRLARVAPVLVEVPARRKPLARLVEDTWIALGGPACLDQATDLADAEVFFALLQRHDQAGMIEDFAAFQEQVNDLKAQAEPDPDIPVKIMTMHKAKGLEFDTVIVPGLHRGSAPSSQRLLLWREHPREPVGFDLLLAPVKGAEEEKDDLYRCLQTLEKQKETWETTRLLYVAATRAQRALHWVAELPVKETKQGASVRPPAGSLLAALWPVLGEEMEEQVLAANPSGEKILEEAGETPPPPLIRLPGDWIAPVPPPNVPWQVVEPPPPPAVDFDWAGQAARHVGTVVHQWLQFLAENPPWPEHPVPSEAHCRALLVHLGTHASELDAAIQRVRKAVTNTLADERGQWILSANHQDAHCEYALSGWLDDQVVHIVMDRTFVDADGIRWIIDYKTGEHAGGGLDHFLAAEQTRYAPQLEKYAHLMALAETRPIRLGLYFPLHQAWRSWSR